VPVESPPSDYDLQTLLKRATLLLAALAVKKDDPLNLTFAGLETAEHNEVYRVKDCLCVIGIQLSWNKDGVNQSNALSRVTPGEFTGSPSSLLDLFFHGFLPPIKPGFKSFEPIEPSAAR
jgi:hypothetical protein